MARPYWPVRRAAYIMHIHQFIKKLPLNNIKCLFRRRRGFNPPPQTHTPLNRTLYLGLHIGPYIVYYFLFGHLGLDAYGFTLLS